MLTRATAIGAILVALSTALTAAEPLAVLECREITGHDWGRTLVTYHLAGPGFKAASVSDGKIGEALPPEGSPGRVRLKAAVRPGEVRLLDASAKEVPFQLSQVRLNQDGALVSARLSFYAELPASGSYHYELLPGKPALSVAAPKMAVAGNMLVLDNAARTTRVVMLEGQTIGYGTVKADVASGPYDLTFHHDKVVGVSEGPGRFVNITQPEGIVQMPTVTADGISSAPGTRGRIAVVPLLDNRYEFVLENLKQPPVFRNWQLW